MRKCTKCQIFKDYSQFGLQRGVSLRYWCKQCHRDDNSLYQKVNAKAVNEKNRKWQRAHQSLMNANQAKRRAIEIHAMPLWLSRADQQIIKDIYKTCKTLTKSTGIEYHVDHIIPLQGENVCGLHVPWNLQILTKNENLKKSNKVVS